MLVNKITDYKITWQIQIVDCNNNLDYTKSSSLPIRALVPPDRELSEKKRKGDDDDDDEDEEERKGDFFINQPSNHVIIRMKNL